MREQALANERRQKKFVDMLLAHQTVDHGFGNGLTLTATEKKEIEENEPFDQAMLFATPEHEPNF